MKANMEREEPINCIIYKISLSNLSNNSIIKS